MRKREISIGNRFAVVGAALNPDKPDDYTPVSAFDPALVALVAGWSVGGLAKPQKEPKKVSFQSFEEALVMTPVPSMTSDEAAHEGKGMDLQLAYAATLKFYDDNNRWPGVHSRSDADAAVVPGKGKLDQGLVAVFAQRGEQLYIGTPQGKVFVKTTATLAVEHTLQVSSDSKGCGIKAIKFNKVRRLRA